MSKKTNEVQDIFSSICLIITILLLPLTIIGAIFGFGEDLTSSYKKYSRK